MILHINVYNEYHFVDLIFNVKLNILMIKVNCRSSFIVHSTRLSVGRY